MSGVAIAWGQVSTDLSLRPINPAWIRGGEPIARGTDLWRSFDRLSCTTIWECTPGQFQWHYDIDETIHLIEGAVVLDDGVAPPRRLGPGDVVFFPAGSVVNWNIEQTVRKIAFFRRPMPKPVALLMRFAIGTVKRLRGSGTTKDAEAMIPAATAVGTAGVLGA